MKIVQTLSRDSIRELHYGFGADRFGRTAVAWDAAGICYFGYVDGDDRSVEAELRSRFPRASLFPESAAVAIGGQAEPVLHLAGTSFQLKVWRTLAGVGCGSRVSYSQLAGLCGCPTAVRAVASAVARNPVSRLIPCHRVVRNDGSIGRYYWGEARKRAMLAWESRADPTAW